MPLKLIGAGFGRTGTMSTFAALNRLGFPCYHMIVATNPKNYRTHLDFWGKVADAPAGTQHDWEVVFSDFSAAVDNPACCAWRELMAAYPDAKVLLTLHPQGPEAWYQSTIDTISRMESQWKFRLLRFLSPFFHKLDKVTHKLVWHRSHKGLMEDRDKAIAHYKQHVDDVRAAVPADRLLVYSVTEGWGLLCAFLDVPVPGEPFPNVNDRAEIQRRVNLIVNVVNIATVVLVLAVAALIYGMIGLFI